jgi:hypothetical protein
MIVMTYKGYDGEGFECLGHQLFATLHTIEDLSSNDYIRREYIKLTEFNDNLNPQFYQLVKISCERIKDAMEQEQYKSITKEQRRKWLINELQKLES